RQEAIVGLFVVVAAGLLIVTVFSLTGFFNRGDVPYRAFFKNAGGLRPGSEVRYAGGPPVGRIEAVRTDAHDTTRMEIDFRIKPDVPGKIDRVASLGTVRGVLDENRQPLHSTVIHFDEASAKIAPLLEDLKKTNADARQTINTLEGTIAENRTDLRQSITDLRHMLETANNVTDQLDRTLNANGE